MKKPKYKTQWTATGFIEQFEFNMTLTDKYIDAYYMTEEDHLKENGDNRYSSYKSFEGVRNYLYNKKK